MTEAELDVLREILATLQRIEQSLELYPKPKLSRRERAVAKLKVLGVEEKLKETVDKDSIATETDLLATQPLVEALKILNVTITHQKSRFVGQRDLNLLSEYIGNNIALLKPHLSEIKIALQGRGTIRTTTSHLTSEDNSIVCQFYTRLRDLAFLKRYHYVHSPKCRIEADVSLAPRAQAFLAGGWFERFIFLQVNDAVNQYNLEEKTSKQLHCLNDAQVLLPNQKEWEIDLFCEVDGLYFLLEMKSSVYQDRLEHFEKVAQMLGFPPECMMFVVLGQTIAQCATLSQTYPSVRVFNETMVKPFVLALLRQKFGTSKNKTNQQPIVSENKTDLDLGENNTNTTSESN